MWITSISLVLSNTETYDLAMSEEQLDSQFIRINEFLAQVKDMKSEDFMKLVETSISDKAIERFCEHIEDFYGVDDDEQIGVLAQIMVTGFLVGKKDQTTLQWFFNF